MSGSYVVGSSSLCVDDGTFIRCPFNSTHRVLAQRFPYHFVKCKESYPDVEVTHCPYNAKHCLRKEELQQHLAVCPQRGRVDPVIVQFPTNSTSVSRPRPAASMIDKSFAMETPLPAPAVVSPPPEPEPAQTYVSFTARALAGELLQNSLTALRSTE